MKRILEKLGFTKNILKHPGKALSDFSLGVVGAYFTFAFIILTILAGLSFWAGFIEDQVFFQITFFFFLIIIFGVAVVMHKVKKGISYLSRRFDKGVTRYLKENHVIDVEVEEE